MNKKGDSSGEKIKKEPETLLNKIVYQDVIEAIDRWDKKDINLNLLSKNKNSKRFFLLYDGKVYPSKPILAVAYYVHFGREIDTINLSGGFCKNGAAKHLADLGFTIISSTDYDHINNHDYLDVNQISAVVYVEDGKRLEYYVTHYERNPLNRKKAIIEHGTQCAICGFDFEKTYGLAGKDYIEVHHIKPLHTLDEEVEINPKTDLICVCANCHRIIHRRRDKVYSIDEVKSMISRNNS